MSHLAEIRNPGLGPRHDAQVNRRGVRRLAVLLVGRGERSEFATVYNSLSGDNVLRADDVHDALLRLESGGFSPDLIVLLQSRPGEFDAESVAQLRRLAPLARLVTLLGSWCEGEARSGHPLPATSRVYWHQWSARYGDGRRRLIDGGCPVWGLPVTATEEEYILSSEDVARSPNVPTAPAGASGVILIQSNEQAAGQWLSAVCRHRHMAAVRVASGRLPTMLGVRGAVWDGASCTRASLREIENLATAVRPAPLIAMFGFPRAEDARRAHNAGAAAVIAKPIRLADLEWHFDRVFHRGSSASP